MPRQLWHGSRPSNHVIHLIRANRDGKLLMDVEADLRLVSYQPGRITFEPAPKRTLPTSPNASAAALHALDRQLAGPFRWSPKAARPQFLRRATPKNPTQWRPRRRDHPLVQAVLSKPFPKAKIKSVRSADELAAEVEAEALPEIDEEWDPFEEE